MSILRFKDFGENAYFEEGEDGYSCFDDTFEFDEEVKHITLVDTPLNRIDGATIRIGLSPGDDDTDTHCPMSRTAMYMVSARGDRREPASSCPRAPNSLDFATPFKHVKYAT